MSQAQARSWWADVEHLREAAERRQAADAERRAAAQRSAERRARAGAPAGPETARARARAATRVRDAGRGAVDELSARRVVVAGERAPRARRPVPIWLADDAFSDPVATARARAAAPRRTIEIRGQVALPAPASQPGGAVQREARPAMAIARRPRESAGLAASFAARPDRIAFWAFALGLVLALVAATSGGHA
jgi:hypothetical protein